MMLKYLHEVLGLLHDFMSEEQEPVTRRADDGPVGDEAVGAAPERREGPAAQRAGR